VSTLSPAQKEELKEQPLPPPAAGAPPVDIDLGQERFLATSTDLPPGSSLSVSLVVLKSYDQATVFLRSLNRWLVGLGLTAILAGGILVFLISDTFTRPLANLVGGVHALERGDFDYPLEARGNDEVSELTRSFDRMRHTVRDAQQELLQAERFATIGRMASTVSHDLRHSLTAILAYAEFLAEGNLPEGRRAEFYQEIRQAVNQMTDQLRELLEFSQAKVVHRPVLTNITGVIDRAVLSVKARSEFSGIEVRTSFDGSSEGWFDPGGLERVFHNLLLNAFEAAPPASVWCSRKARCTLSIHLSGVSASFKHGTTADTSGPEGSPEGKRSARSPGWRQTAIPISQVQKPSRRFAPPGDRFKEQTHRWQTGSLGMSRRRRKSTAASPFKISISGAWCMLPSGRWKKQGRTVPSA